MSNLFQRIGTLLNLSAGKTDEALRKDSTFAKEVSEFANQLASGAIAEAAKPANKFSEKLKFTSDKKLGDGKKLIKLSISFAEGDSVPLEATGIEGANGVIETILVEGAEMISPVAVAEGATATLDPAAPAEPVMEVEMEAAPTDPEKMEAPAEPAATPEKMATELKVGNLTMKIGEVGEPVMVMDEGGNTITATEGVFVATDGTQIMVDQDGKLVSLVPPTPEQMSKFGQLLAQSAKVSQMHFAAMFASPNVPKTKAGDKPKAKAPETKTDNYAALEKQLQDQAAQLIKLQTELAAAKQPAGKQTFSNEDLKMFNTQQKSYLESVLTQTQN